MPTGRMRNDTEGVNQLSDYEIHQHLSYLSLFLYFALSGLLSTRTLPSRALEHTEACTPCPAFHAISLRVSPAWNDNTPLSLAGMFNPIFSASVVENKKTKRKKKKKGRRTRHLRQANKPLTDVLQQ